MAKFIKLTKKVRKQIDTMHQLGTLLLEKVEQLKEYNRLGIGHSDPRSTIELIDEIGMLVAEIKKRQGELL
jgi:hypothetical protein